MSEEPRFRRPTRLTPSMMDTFAAESLDPAVITQVAHDTAALLVHHGRSSDDPAVTDRLVAIVDELGLTTLAQLWSDRPGRSLPGALWRLYVLREWVRRDPAGASADFREGSAYADVSAVVAGVASPPGPAEVRDLADAILRGVYDGDVAVAFNRAAAFARVVSAGRASRGPDALAADTPGAGEASARSAANVLTMADDLDAAAGAWRRGELT